MKRLLFISWILYPLFLQAQKTDSARAFVDSALNIMQKRSLFAKNLNWEKIRDSVHIMAKDAVSYEQTAPALKFAFNLLNDKHGWLVLNNESYSNPFMLRDNSRINGATMQVITKPMVRCAVVNKQYAYLSMPFFGGQTLKAMNDFAQKVQDSLCKVVSSSTKGIIIDLRLNGGGNMYPMVVGLSNIIGNGKLTETVNSEGVVDGELVMKNYMVTLLDTMVVRLSRSCGNLEKLPLAILIGPATGSSGEQLALILSLRKNSVLIGEATAGYVSGNNGFLLPGKDNGIVIGESYTRDSKGRIYFEDVQPEIKIIGGDNFTDLSQDSKIKSAIDWFLKKK